MILEKNTFQASGKKDGGKGTDDRCKPPGFRNGKENR